MAPRVLLIDDDERLGAMLVDYLGNAGFEVSLAHDAAAGLRQLGSAAFDVLLLDVMLPDADGFDVCRQVRAATDIPIVMLTARGDETDRVVGLELGADDYLAKPFGPRELLARLRALLRRRHATLSSASTSPPLRFGRLEIDRDARLVRVDGEERPLTSHQFSLLVALAESAGRVLSRDRLMELVRGHGVEAFDRSIDVHVSRIRAAVEDDPRRPRRIVTVRGIGYVFARRLEDEASG